MQVCLQVIHIVQVLTSSEGKLESSLLSLVQLDFGDVLLKEFIVQLIFVPVRLKWLGLVRTQLPLILIAARG